MMLTDAAQESYNPLLDNEQPDVAVHIRNRRQPMQTKLKVLEDTLLISTKSKSFSREITKKYLKKVGNYLLAIGGGVLVIYVLAPVINAPMMYFIVPLSASVAGTLLSNKVNKLISALSYFTPKMLLDENDEILQRAEKRIAELRKVDNENESDHFSAVIQELQKNISICQGILESGGSAHFSYLFIEDIKRLMNIPSKSLSQQYQMRFNASARERMRDEIVKQVRGLLEPYDIGSKDKLSKFITQIMQKLLPETGAKKLDRVMPIFLDGPPGIGKTRLIKELSKIFSIPVLTIDMGTVTLEEIEGTQLPNSIGLPTCRPGLILKELTNKLKNPEGCNNLIVLLDEVDKAFTKGNTGASDATAKVIGWLHPTLQTDKLSLQDKGYNIPVDVSEVIAVCTANRNCFADEYIEESTRKSLQDRVSMIKMPKLERKSKEMILQKHMSEKVSLDKSLSLIQKVCIVELMRSKINNIVATDKTPGLRWALQMLESSYGDSYTYTLDKCYGIRSIAGIIEEYASDLPANGNSDSNHATQETRVFLPSFDASNESGDNVSDEKPVSANRQIRCRSCAIL